MYAGVKLKQAFGGTGYSDNVRFFQDFGSRIYFMQEADIVEGDIIEETNLEKVNLENVNIEEVNVKK